MPLSNYVVKFIDTKNKFETSYNVLPLQYLFSETDIFKSKNLKRLTSKRHKLLNVLRSKRFSAIRLSSSLYFWYNTLRYVKTVSNPNIFTHQLKFFKKFHANKWSCAMSFRFYKNAQAVYACTYINKYNLDHYALYYFAAYCQNQYIQYSTNLDQTMWESINITPSNCNWFFWGKQPRVSRFQQR